MTTQSPHLALSEAKLTDKLFYLQRTIREYQDAVRTSFSFGGATEEKILLVYELGAQIALLELLLRSGLNKTFARFKRARNDQMNKNVVVAAQIKEKREMATLEMLSEATTNEGEEPAEE